MECVNPLCPEPPRSGSSAVHAIDGPATAVPISTTSVFVAIAALMAALTISLLCTEVMRWLLSL
jgi:hypothetical protein